VHAARKQDRRLAVALLAAAVAHTPEGEEVLRGARMRMARKPSAVARELLKNFPKSGRRRRRRKRGGDDAAGGEIEATTEALAAGNGAEPDGEEEIELEASGEDGAEPDDGEPAEPVEVAEEDAD
jgi:ribonuclease E